MAKKNRYDISDEPSRKDIEEKIRKGEREYTQGSIIALNSKIIKEYADEYNTGMCFGIATMIAIEFLKGEKNFKEAIDILNYIYSSKVLEAEFLFTEEIRSHAEESLEKYKKTREKISHEIKETVKAVREYTSREDNESSIVDCLVKVNEAIPLNENESQDLKNQLELLLNSESKAKDETLAAKIADHMIFEVENGELLTEEDRILLNIRALCDTISVLQRPEKFKDLIIFPHAYPDQLRNITLRSGLSLFSSQQNQIELMEIFTGFFNKESLKQSLLKMKDCIVEQNEKNDELACPFSLVICSTYHGIDVSYDPSNGWYVSDPNHLPGKWEEDPDRLASSIYDFLQKWHFTDKGKEMDEAEELYFSIRLLGKSDNKKEIEQAVGVFRTSEEWKNVETASIENIDTKIINFDITELMPEEEYTLMHFAKVQHDLYMLSVIHDYYDKRIINENNEKNRLESTLQDLEKRNDGKESSETMIKNMKNSLSSMEDELKTMENNLLEMDLYLKGVFDEEENANKKPSPDQNQQDEEETKSDDLSENEPDKNTNPFAFFQQALPANTDPFPDGKDIQHPKPGFVPKAD